MMSLSSQVFVEALVILFGYLVLDITTHFRMQNKEESIRRVPAVAFSYSFVAYLLYFVYVQLFGVMTVQPQLEVLLFTVLWIGSLIASVVVSWKLYYKMLAHSGTQEYAKVDVLEVARKKTEEMLSPMFQYIFTMRSAVDDLKLKIGALAQGDQKVSDSISGMSKNIANLADITTRTKNDVDFRREQFNLVIQGYNKWFQEHKDDAAISAKNHQVLEALLERAEVVLDALDEYIASIDGGVRESEKPSVSGEITTQAAPSSASNNNGDHHEKHELTREDGLRSREKGNRAQMKFSEYLRATGIELRSSLLNGEPDYLFYKSSNLVAVGAYKALTLSVEATKQRRIYRAKLLAEVRAGMKYNMPVMLFVFNLVNGRTWAYVIAPDDLKNFKGITTPMMLVESEPASEKACKDTLTMALRLLQ
jgi:hypothetical protein